MKAHITNRILGRWKGMYIALAAAVAMTLVAAVKSRPTETAQFVTAAAAILATVAAIAVSDPRRPKAELSVSVSVDQKSLDVHRLSDCTPSLRQDLDELGLSQWPSTTNPAMLSRKVYFTLVNRSGIELREPVLTFVLPQAGKHPSHQDAPFVAPHVYNLYGYHSNLHNVPRERRQFDVAKDRVAIANILLPYWPDGVEWQVWIRLAFEGAAGGDFPVEVYLNCQDAEGWHKTVTVRNPVVVSAHEMLERLDSGKPDKVQPSSSGQKT